MNLFGLQVSCWILWPVVAIVLAGVVSIVKEQRRPAGKGGGKPRMVWLFLTALLLAIGAAVVFLGLLFALLGDWVMRREWLGPASGPNQTTQNAKRP